MKTTELRIGNLVLWNDVETVVTVQHLVMMLGVHSFRCKPILINEDLLKRFGFDSIQEDKFNCNINYTHSKTPEYLIQYHTDVNEYIFYGASNSIDKIIKYAHQLQNLYFALTETEL